LAPWVANWLPKRKEKKNKVSKNDEKNLELLHSQRKNESHI
jgi:hypothetical protein